MADEVNNSNTEMLQRFKRDEKLMWPKGFQTKQDYKFYTEYLHDLVDNQTFVAASRIAESKITKAKTKHKNKNRITNVILCTLIMSLCAGACVTTYNMPTTYEWPDKEKRFLWSVLVIATMLFGAGMCVVTNATNIGNTTSKYNEKPEVFYNRLIVRYFDVLKKIYPEMSEKYLEICNQPDMEMARAIYSLLIVNMDEEDVEKLNEIALSVNWQLFDDKAQTMQDIEEKIRGGIQIIEKTLTAHPELQTIVKDAYAAKVPTTFFVANVQKRGRGR